MTTAQLTEKEATSKKASSKGQGLLAGHPMTKYVLTRVRQSVITLILVSIVVFAGIRALPGDPALALAGEERSPAALAAIRAEYGLDDNIVIQFGRFIGHALQGDLGTSSRTGLPVADAIGQALPVTLELAALSLLLAIVLGIGAGVVAAVRRGRPAEWIANGLALLGLSIPTFWLGIVLVLAFAIIVPVFAASGFVPFGADPIDNLRRMVLPAIVLGSGLAAVVMRQTRAAMLDSLSADYVRTARAKGLSRREVVGGHALRNSLVTVVTVLGLQLGHLISGAVVTEQIFVLPGFGKLTIDAVFTRDYATLQGVVLCTSAAYIFINLLVDVAYSVIDPRIRLGGAR
ncbi:ABC transporter permease [Streptomyces sp. NBC_00147]